MTRNEELLTVTDENEEKLRTLVEKAKTCTPELFQQYYKITPEEFEKKSILELLRIELLKRALLRDISASLWI